MSERVGFFGGTFDPIHNAHLGMARAAASQCGLDRVLFVPASNPPHRNGTHAAYEDRLRMVQIACAPDPAFCASRLEEGPGKSYSILSIEHLIQEHGADRQVFFVIGADAYADIRSWYRWRDLAKLVTFAVVGRPGASYEVSPETNICHVNGISLPGSSSEARTKLAAGDQSVDLPPGVLQYIREHHLYGVA